MHAYNITKTNADYRKLLDVLTKAGVTEALVDGLAGDRGVVDDLATLIATGGGGGGSCGGGFAGRPRSRAGISW